MISTIITMIIFEKYNWLKIFKKFIYYKSYLEPENYFEVKIDLYNNDIINGLYDKRYQKLLISRHSNFDKNKLKGNDDDEIISSGYAQTYKGLYFDSERYSDYTNQYIEEYLFQNEEYEYIKLRSGL